MFLESRNGATPSCWILCVSRYKFHREVKLFEPDINTYPNYVTRMTSIILFKRDLTQSLMMSRGRSHCCRTDRQTDRSNNTERTETRYGLTNDASCYNRHLF